MITFKSWKLLLLLCEIVLGISASTHWIVTENGIQSHLDSPFHMRRPYDLLSFLDQEVRHNKIYTLFQSLVSRKDHILNKWSGLKSAVDIETRLYNQDSDCLKAGKLLSEIDLYASIAADGSDREGIKLADFLIEDVPADASIVPECHKIIDLDFSMFAFEHLAAMINRANLTMLSEASLTHWLKPGTTLPNFGHQVALGLLKNSTSWLHHNLGAIYWRIRGDAYRAIECGRRAVHFAPREFRDIALLNLANIFHQARYPGEAAIILHAAIDHAPFQPVNHFALGNVYAILADYNRSIACYDNCLKLQPSLAHVFITKHAVLCHKKLEMGLKELNDALQVILSELHDYHSQQEQWLKLQEKLIKEQVPFEAKLLSITPDSFLLAGRGQTCTQTDDDSKLSCTVNNHNEMHAYNLQILLQNVESQAQKISEQMAKNSKRDTVKVIKKTIDLSEFNMKRDENLFLLSDTMKSNKEDKSKNLYDMPSEEPKYSPKMLLSWENLKYDSPNWPSKKQCQSWKSMKISEKKNNRIFLPPENKGFQVKRMLSDLIDLPPDAEHVLPWYPPVCSIKDTNLIVEKYFPSALLKQSSTVIIESDSRLSSHLLQYVNEGKSIEAEIGQRILTAMHKKIGPEWLLATLSSLYWRVRSNNRNALDCLKVALTTVPQEHRDVVLVSLASIMHQLGFITEALKTAGEAFSINRIEPATNFLLALLHKEKSNSFLAIFHMKRALRSDPDFYDGEAANFLKYWSCELKLSDSDKTESSAKDQCSESDRTVSLSGEGVLCSATGEQCKMAAIQCYKAERLPEEGNIIMLESTPITKLINSEHCSEKIEIGSSLITKLLAANIKSEENSEGSGNIEPDQSRLESLIDSGHKPTFHMKISLSDDSSENSRNSLGDFYDDSNAEALLHVYDRSGTYVLSPKNCKEIKDADWLHFTSMWQSVAARNIDIGPFLKPLPVSLTEPIKPQCDETPLFTRDHLTIMKVHHHLVHSPEPDLAEWLVLLANDQKSSIQDLGTKIAIALNENTTSWVLAMAASLYWRIIGYTDQAVMCLGQSLSYAPLEFQDIPLINLANVLQRVGILEDALEVATLALKIHPNFVVNHFTVGNIYSSLGEYEEAFSFYRSSLYLDPNFEPARNRLQAILCTLLFDESGTLRETSDFVDN